MKRKTITWKKVMVKVTDLESKAEEKTCDICFKFIVKDHFTKIGSK